MKIGIYGGSYNPIHLGHMTAACNAIKLLSLDRLLLIPTGLPPHKKFPSDTPPSEDRVAMLSLAADQIALQTGIPVEVDEREISREGKSYSALTVAQIKAEHPQDALYLLMGTDMFLTFQHWYEPQSILDNCTLCAFGRSEQDTQELFAEQTKYLQAHFANVRIVTCAIPDVIDISSTQLRDALQKGEGGNYLSPQVYGYILRRNLYGTSLDMKRLTIDQLRPIALSYLKAKRVAHVLGTEKAAGELASQYGVDVQKARVAALLHDCTKRLEMEEQLALCEKYRIALDALERKNLKLLHAKTGAAIARDVFGVDDEVYYAIFWHTTGKADMTMLEKVIYLADYMEPTRKFDGVDALREAVHADIDRGLAMGLSMSVEEMKQYGKELHSNTRSALEFIKEQINEP